MSIGLLQVKVEPIPTVCPHGHSGTTEPLPGNLASKNKKKKKTTTTTMTTTYLKSACLLQIWPPTLGKSHPEVQWFSMQSEHTAEPSPAPTVVVEGSSS